mmetsp:Transcript_12917/g.33467  ORF Transcript_12917/g.33467 Transcript_12917/m.33467 type:complete len:100 (-) Transcript_12917:2-301(-)
MEGREGGGGGSEGGGPRARRKVMTAQEYERANKPFRAPTERVPTIGEQWAYAARRYSKYQGYAWSGVALVAGLAFVASYITDEKREDGTTSSQATPPPK